MKAMESPVGPANPDLRIWLRRPAGLRLDCLGCLRGPSHARVNGGHSNPESTLVSMYLGLPAAQHSSSHRRKRTSYDGPRFDPRGTRFSFEQYPP